MKWSMGFPEPHLPGLGADLIKALMLLTQLLTALGQCLTPGGFEAEGLHIGVACGFHTFHCAGDSFTRLCRIINHSQRSLQQLECKWSSHNPADDRD